MMRLRHVVLMLLAAVAAGLLSGLTGVVDRAVAAQRTARPNVVLIQVDDMSPNILRSQFKSRRGLRDAMPNTLGLLAGQGVEFRRYHASNPICGPSRASLLTGRSTHNHGMRINAYPYGYRHFKNSDLYEENLPVWLNRSGYRTAHIGKYINGYGADDGIPPGWDDWITTVPNYGAPYYGGALFINGETTPPLGSFEQRDPRDCEVKPPWVVGACLHATDMQTALARREIRLSTSERRPFFLSLDYNAPHDDGRRAPGPEPQPRFRGLVRKVKSKVARDDVAGNRRKPFFISELSELTPDLRRRTRERYANEVVAMHGVDEGIGDLVGELRRTGQLRNTYVIFLSDNGFFHGEHRIAYGKYLPHEPSSKQPLLIRGPSIPRGKVSRESATNLDIASTILRMTGTRSTTWKDGRSLLEYAKNPKSTSGSPMLLEGFNAKNDDDPEVFLDGGGGTGLNQALVLNYSGFVAGRWKYIKYLYGEEELYDLKVDPGEQWNLVQKGKFTNVLGWARSLGLELSDCAGQNCHPEVDPPGRPR